MAIPAVRKTKARPVTTGRTANDSSGIRPRARKKVVRGLMFHEYGELLPAHYRAKTWLDADDEVAKRIEILIRRQ
jgi:hypothetical protein